jgi:hypothetical protein
MGSPPLKPSMMNEVERQFEALEETMFEAGVTRAKKANNVRIDQDEFLELVLVELERTNPESKFDRDRIQSAVNSVRSNQEIPF